MEVAKSDRVGQINRTVVLENYGLADILSGHCGVGWGGVWWGGGALDIYTVDIAILTIVCYMYTGKKCMGSLSCIFIIK